MGKRILLKERDEGKMRRKGKAVQDASLDGAGLTSFSLYCCLTWWKHTVRLGRSRNHCANNSCFRAHLSLDSQTANHASVLPVCLSVIGPCDMEQNGKRELLSRCRSFKCKAMMLTGEMGRKMQDRYCCPLRVIQNEVQGVTERKVDRNEQKELKTSWSK